MKLKSFLRYISAVLLLSLLLNSYIIPVSSEETIVVGQSTIHNGGFEYPNLKDADTANTGWKSIAFDDAAYDTNQLSWKTTATDKNLEYAWLRNTSALAEMSPPYETYYHAGNNRWCRSFKRCAVCRGSCK